MPTGSPFSSGGAAKRGRMNGAQGVWSAGLDEQLCKQRNVRYREAPGYPLPECKGAAVTPHGRGATSRSQHACRHGIKHKSVKLCCFTALTRESIARPGAVGVPPIRVEVVAVPARVCEGRDPQLREGKRGEQGKKGASC